MSPKAVLVASVPPLLLKTAANPGGTPIEAFDQIRAAVQADRSQFWKDLSVPFYGDNRPGAKVSEGVRESFWLQEMMAGFPAAYFCVKAFSETDQNEDLKKFDVPTLILAGDDDQMVPYADAALLQAKLVKDAALKIYKGAPHGLCTTVKDQVSADLLAFFKGCANDKGCANGTAVAIQEARLTVALGGGGRRARPAPGGARWTVRAKG